MDKRTLIKFAMAFLITTGCSAFALATETPASIEGVKTISAEEAKKMQATGVPLIDTRVAAEYAEKTAKGAKSVPYKEKSEKAPNFDATKDDFDLSKLPADKNAPIVFFCNAGECWKSYKASVVAKKAGYTKIYWMRNGFPEWIAKGLPTQ